MPPRRACDICFKRKIQCAIPSPGAPCNWCSHQNIACTFEREPQRKKQDLKSDRPIPIIHPTIPSTPTCLPNPSYSHPVDIIWGITGTSESTIQRATDLPVLDDTFLHETVTKAYKPLKDTIAARSSLSAEACKLFKQYFLFKPIEHHRANGEATAP
ncbi:hypothetical protein HYQ45_001419 [Verticillium longisporum]|uniref:Zn(2)-C6 fungal-type domain-containing protein n=1 Tax=Verticillium longisporum TaxID=100787 RepID=A0A8I3A0G4_VERLO|nr:hypothetical protein HYQ45_001419 [Verticillium longisporum]